MGADLICYIAFGPKRIALGERKSNLITRQVRGYLDACIAAAERLLLGRKEIPDPRGGPVEAKCSITFHLELAAKDKPPEFSSLEQLRSHPKYQDLVRGVLADCDHEVEASHAFGGTPQDLADEVRDFVANWNQGRFRDLTCRDDPEKPGRKVVVAGELSWGDEPDGAGYQMLKKAFGLGIAQRLGVK